MKLGSLFDGIGGFPLAATRCGITPAWASEIEPGPTAITKKHFPDMVHLGDVTKIDGAAVEPVDVITFGSPCQDLSVAGKRAGLDGARSGLFMEAVRIIKEMREKTHGEQPRFAVWENVPGAFSSNKGDDFRVVVEELCRVKDPAFEVPAPPGSKWEPAGLVEGSGWSIAWRVLDAQFWGVPQRRKRIFLVADFTGGSAGQILFERESLRRDFAAGEGKGQGTAADAERGAGTTVDGLSLFENHSQDTRYVGPLKVSPIISANFGMGGNNTPFVTQPITFNLRGRDGGAMPEVDPDTLANIRAASGGSSKSYVAKGYKVRRLTPTECERLQGYPDGWTEGHSDTVRYKALGNSVAVPCVEYVMEGLVWGWLL